MKEQPPRKRRVVSLTLSNETIERLDQRSKELGIPRTQVAEVVLRSGLGILLPHDTIAPIVRCK